MPTSSIPTVASTRQTQTTPARPTAVFFSELKTAFMKVAFQQWKIVIQDAMIQEAKHRITSKAQPVSTTTQTMPTIPTPTKSETRSTTTRASNKISSKTAVATEKQATRPRRR